MPEFDKQYLEALRLTAAARAIDRTNFIEGENR